MARPVNKEELVVFSELSFNELLSFIDGLPENAKNKVYKNNELNDRDKTIADVICHLHEWHLMRMTWYEQGMSGIKPELSYSFKTLLLINHRIYDKYEGTELGKALTLFKKSHKKVMTLIEKHTDEELFTKKKYEFTGSTSLGAYFFYNTVDHYNWALKTLKPCAK